MDDKSNFESTKVFATLQDQIAHWLASNDGIAVRTTPVRLSTTGKISTYQQQSMKLFDTIPLENWIISTMNSIELLLNSAWDKVRDEYGDRERRF